MSENTPTKRGTVAQDIVRLASLWVAAGALYKLFAGSPNDMPPQLTDLLGARGIPSALFFRLAITVELLVVILCLFRPRMGWIFLSLLFVLFDALLFPLVQGGAESCGCFGGTIKIEPLHMMITDTVLLIAVLASRPWSGIPKQVFFPLVPVLLAGVSAWAPWHLIKTEGTLPPKQPRVEADEPETTGDDTSSSGTTDAAAEEPDPAGAEEPAGGEGEDANSGSQPEQPAEQPAEDVGLASVLDFYEFQPETWVGKELFELDLTNFVDVYQLPDTCHVVFYRRTCPVCAEHFEQLIVEPPPVPLVLIRIIEEKDATEEELTVNKPFDHIHLEIPSLKRGYGMKTPVAMDVEGYMVTHVEEIEH